MTGVQTCALPIYEHGYNGNSFTNTNRSYQYEEGFEKGRDHALAGIPRRYVFKPVWPFATK